eukprot:Sspe_Gene.6408::Locus_2165_Transcript_1_1_Confidence_1.000_Length_3155::g.6408::m.6408
MSGLWSFRRTSEEQAVAAAGVEATLQPENMLRDEIRTKATQLAQCGDTGESDLDRLLRRMEELAGGTDEAAVSTPARSEAIFEDDDEAAGDALEDLRRMLGLGEGGSSGECSSGEGPKGGVDEVIHRLEQRVVCTGRGDPDVGDEKVRLGDIEYDPRLYPGIFRVQLEGEKAAAKNRFEPPSLPAAFDTSGLLTRKLPTERSSIEVHPLRLPRRTEDVPSPPHWGRMKTPSSSSSLLTGKPVQTATRPVMRSARAPSSEVMHLTEKPRSTACQPPEMLLRTSTPSLPHPPPPPVPSPPGPLHKVLSPELHPVAIPSTLVHSPDGTSSTPRRLASSSCALSLCSDLHISAPFPRPEEELQHPSPSPHCAMPLGLHMTPPLSPLYPSCAPPSPGTGLPSPEREAASPPHTIRPAPSPQLCHHALTAPSTPLQSKHASPQHGEPSAPDTGSLGEESGGVAALPNTSLPENQQDVQHLPPPSDPAPQQTQPVKGTPPTEAWPQPQASPSTEVWPQPHQTSPSTEAWKNHPLSPPSEGHLSDAPRTTPPFRSPKREPDQPTKVLTVQPASHAQIAVECQPILHTRPAMDCIPLHRLPPRGGRVSSSGTPDTREQHASLRGSESLGVADHTAAQPSGATRRLILHRLLVEYEAGMAQKRIRCAWAVWRRRMPSKVARALASHHARLSGKLTPRNRNMVASVSSSSSAPLEIATPSTQHDTSPVTSSGSVGPISSRSGSTDKTPPGVVRQHDDPLGDRLAARHRSRIEAREQLRQRYQLALAKQREEEERKADEDRAERLVRALRERKQRELQEAERASRREQLAKAKRHYKRTLMRRFGIVPWKRLMELREEQLEKAVAHHNLAVARRGLGEMREGVQQWKQVRHLIHVLRCVMWARLLQQCMVRGYLRRWRACVRDRATDHAIAAVQHRNHLLRKMLQQWRNRYRHAYAMKQEHYLSLAVQARAVSQRRVLRHAFSAWMERFNARARARTRTRIRSRMLSVVKEVLGESAVLEP